ncbi:hypothetical protein ACWD4K_36245, partial [Streptomyces gelaticus]
KKKKKKKPTNKKKNKKTKYHNKIPVTVVQTGAIPTPPRGRHRPRRATARRGPRMAPALRTDVKGVLIQAA